MEALGRILGQAWDWLKNLPSKIASAITSIFDIGGKFLGIFQQGTPYVPKTGLALVHQGERIIPAHRNVVGREAATGRGGGLGGTQVFIEAPVTVEAHNITSMEEIGTVIGDSIMQKLNAEVRRNW